MKIKLADGIHAIWLEEKLINMRKNVYNGLQKCQFHNKIFEKTYIKVLI